MTATPGMAPDREHFRRTTVSQDHDEVSEP